MHIVIGSVWVVPAVPADRLLLAASVDMIPLMMQKGYKAKGWLGLILGTRLYYTFHGAEVDDDAAFEKQMDAVAREIGDRGKHRLQEAVPPARTAARASGPRPAAAAPAPAPTPAPAPAPAPARALPASPRPVAPRAATPERSFSPSLQMQTVAAPPQTGATGSFAELSAFMEKQQALFLEQQALLLARDEKAKQEATQVMEAKLERAQADMDKLREEMKAQQDHLLGQIRSSTLQILSERRAAKGGADDA